MFAILFVFLGENIVSALGGNNAPNIVKDTHKYVQENKIYVGMVSFFGMSMILSSLGQSGAFEIYINENLEYSKLQTGEMPNFNVIRDILVKYEIRI